jgi:hypothetical protein
VTLSVWMKVVVGTYGRGKGVPLHAMEAPGGRGSVASTHIQPQH